MQGLKVLPAIVDEIASVNEIVDGRMHRQMENRTPMLHHASRCDNNCHGEIDHKIISVT